MRKAAINKFKNMELSDDEKIDIFTPEKRKVCQSCHKVKIRKIINLDGFTDDYRQNYICICHTQQQQNHQQHQNHQQQINNDNQIINLIDQDNADDNNVIQNNQNDSESIIEPDAEDFNGEQESESIYQNPRDNAVNNEQNIEQNSDDNEFVTKREFRNLCERIERGFMEINEKLDKKVDK